MFDPQKNFGSGIVNTDVNQKLVKWKNCLICNASEKDNFQKAVLTMLLFFYTKSIPGMRIFYIYFDAPKQQHIPQGDTWDVVHVDDN